MGILKQSIRGKREKRPEDCCFRRFRFFGFDKANFCVILRDLFLKFVFHKKNNII